MENYHKKKKILETWLLQKFGQIMVWSSEDLIELAKNQKIETLEGNERLNKQKILIQLIVIIFTSKSEGLQKLIKNIEAIELERLNKEDLS